MKKHCLVPLALTLAFLGGGCTAPTKPAIKLDPTFDPMTVDLVTILPAVDGRLDKSANVNVQSAVRKAAAAALKGRKYKVNAIKSDTSSITADELESPSSAWIKQIGPSDADWVMVIVLNDASTKLVFGSTGNADVSGYLFDKDSGKLVWYDKGVGQAGQGGLVGMMMRSMMDSEAIRVAVFDLMQSVPLRKKME